MYSPEMTTQRAHVLLLTMHLFLTQQIFKLCLGETDEKLDTKQTNKLYMQVKKSKNKIVIYL